MRIFTAVVPPEDAVEDLQQFLDPRREAGADLHWTDPGRWHVTLAFMAQVRESQLERLLDAVAGSLDGQAPIPLRCSGGGAFPNPYAARVLWTGVTGAGSAGRDLSALAQGIRGACSRAGTSPDGRAFHPHVTLARTGQPVEATRWLRVLDAYDGPAWVADEVTVFASRGNGTRYEALAAIDLTGVA